jgi:serpin B
MILFGARGPTAVEIGQKLFSSEDNDIALNVTTSTILHYRNLLHRLNRGNGTRLLNHIYVDRQFDLDPDFSMSTKEFFQANINQVDFSGKKENPIRLVNQKVSEETGEDIKSVIEFVSPNTKLLLLNLLTFKKEWKIKFDQRRTKKRPFMLENGKNVMTDTMYLMSTIDIGASEELNCTAVRIPFRNGRLYFVILLPREGTTERQLIKVLNTKDLQDLFQRQMTKTKTKVLLPKFKLEWSDSLIPSLRESGIKRMFDVQYANFSGISPQSSGLFVGDLIQKVSITLDEEGSRAAAATAASFKQRSLSFSEDFIVNRPFVFLIGSFNQKTLTDVLFMGKFSAPKDS